MKTINLVILCIPTVLLALSLLLFVLQGGFGGGHGPFDRWIALAGFPGILLVEKSLGVAADALSIPEIVLIVLLPGTLNILPCAGIVAAIHAIGKRRGDASITSTESANS